MTADVVPAVPAALLSRPAGQLTALANPARLGLLAAVVRPGVGRPGLLGDRAGR